MAPRLGCARQPRSCAVGTRVNQDAHLCTASRPLRPAIRRRLVSRGVVFALGANTAALRNRASPTRKEKPERAWAFWLPLEALLQPRELGA